MIRNLYQYRELLVTLAWKNVALRYKQAYLGIAWAVIKPITLMLIFTLVRSFVGIDSGSVPYPVLTFAALMPWTFFQESASDGVNSVVGNAALIKKIYFPREIFPITSVLTKLVELGINICILAALMAWYEMIPTIYILWAPLILFYTVIVALSVSFLGAAINVYYRDVSTVLPVVLSLLMYLSPVIYPLRLVKEKLLNQHMAGDWSGFFYSLYVANPLVGIIDAFQSVVLLGQAPDVNALLPGMILAFVSFPISYFIFKRAEYYFADVI